MALAQKYSTEATTKTHGLVDASIADIVLPSAGLDSTGNLIRGVAYGAAGYLFARKQVTGSFFGQS